MLAETVVEIQFQEFWEYTIKPQNFTSNDQLMVNYYLDQLGPNL